MDKDTALTLASIDDLIGEILTRCSAQDGLFVCAYGTPPSGTAYRVVGDPFAAIGHMIHMTDSLRARISGDDDDGGLFDLDDRGNPVPVS